MASVLDSSIEDIITALQKMGLSADDRTRIIKDSKDLHKEIYDLILGKLEAIDNPLLETSLLFIVLNELRLDFNAIVARYGIKL